MADAYTIIEGTNFVINPQFGFNISGGITNSAQAWANQASVSIRRDTFELLTFNSSGGWSQPLPRMLAGVITVGGFVTHGDVLSDPLSLITLTEPIPFSLSVTPKPSGSSITMTGDCVAVSEDDSFAALDASGRQQSFKTYGPITTAGFTS